MESHDTLTTTSQCDTIDKLLESDDAIKYLPNGLRKFFLAARNSTSLEAIEQAIEAYKKASKIDTINYKRQIQSDENIEKLLMNSTAVEHIPNDLIKALNAGKKLVTPEILSDLIDTFMIINKESTI